MSNVKAIIVSKMTSHCAGTLQIEYNTMQICISPLVASESEALDERRVEKRDKKV